MRNHREEALELAKKSGGKTHAYPVAAALSISISAAVRLLNGLVDEGKMKREATEWRVS